MGYLPQKWKGVWEQLEHPIREQLIRQMSFNTQIVRSHGRTIHKRSTIDILVKGIYTGNINVPKVLLKCNPENISPKLTINVV